MQNWDLKVVCHFEVLKQQDADKLTRRTPNEIASEKSEDL